MLAAALLCSSLCAMGDGIPGTKSDEPITWQKNVDLNANGEWAMITGETPIFFSVPSQTNIFTVAFDVDVPNATGTIFGFASSGGGEISVRRKTGGTLVCSSEGFEPKNTVGDNVTLSPGMHHIAVAYLCNDTGADKSIYGTTVYLDGVKVYHSHYLAWGQSYTIPLMSIGAAAITTPLTDVIGNLHVRNLRFWDGLRPGTYVLVY